MRPEQTLDVSILQISDFHNTVSINWRKVPHNIKNNRLSPVIYHQNIWWTKGDNVRNFLSAISTESQFVYQAQVN